MNIQKQLMIAKNMMLELEESDREIMQELIKLLEKKKRIDEPDDYVDFLLGIAAECDEKQERAMYDIIDYIQEMEM